MTLFLRVCAGVLLTVILVLALKNYNKEIGAILAVAACVMTAIAALNYLQPVVHFLYTLEEIGGLNDTMVKLLLKSTGIGVITEIAMLVCKDTGNESMGKAMQLLGCAVILYLSMPLFTSLLELLQQILEDL